MRSLNPTPFVPGAMYVFVMRTIGGCRNEIARALPVGCSPSFAAVSREWSRPTRIPSLMSGVSCVGVPSSSYGSVPRSPCAAPLSPTLSTGFPKRRPSVFIHEAFGHLSEADFVYENPQAREMMTLGVYVHEVRFGQM